MKKLIILIGLILVVCLLVPVSCAKAPTPAPASTKAPVTGVVPGPQDLGRKVWNQE